MGLMSMYIQLAEKSLAEKSEVEQFLKETHGEEIYEKIDKLLRADLSTEEIVQLARITRVYNLMEYGIVEPRELESRFEIEKINIERMLEVTKHLELSELYGMLETYLSIV